MFVPRPLFAPWEQFFWFSFCSDAWQGRKESAEVSVISKMSLTWGSTKATINMYYWKYWRSQCPLLFNRCYFSFFEWVCWPWRADNPVVESFLSCVVSWFIAPCKEQNLSPLPQWSITEYPCRGCSGKVGFRVQEKMFSCFYVFLCIFMYLFLVSLMLCWP